MFEISVKTHFSGAHRLTGYDGPCSSVHGHNWEVEVFMRGESLDNAGMLVDFAEVKKAVSFVLSDYDHRDLNTLDWFSSHNPTSENICRHIYDKLASELDCERFKVHRVTVRETPGSAASYWAE